MVDKICDKCYFNISDCDKKSILGSEFCAYYKCSYGEMEKNLSNLLNSCREKEKYFWELYGDKDCDKVKLLDAAARLIHLQNGAIKNLQAKIKKIEK